MNGQNIIVDASPSPTTPSTANPTDNPSIAPTPSDAPSPSEAPTPSTATVACPGLEAPQDVRISDLNLPGNTTSPLGNPVVAGCALWITSGANGGGIHRIDVTTGAKTNPNPAEIVFSLDTNGDQLWALGTTKAVNGTNVLYQLDMTTGATVRELPLSNAASFPQDMRIIDGRAWVSGYHSPLQVIDLASGELVGSAQVFGPFQVGAGGVWSGLSRINPATFEVTELQTSFPANDVAVVGDRLYGIDQVHGVVARLDPVSGQVLTSVQVDNWTGGDMAVERNSIWILRTKEPPTLPLKPVKTEILRIDAATGQIADRIPLDVVSAIDFSATDGNLWLVDQPSRLRHGFIRIQLPPTD
jgi:hypothetical protein